MDNNYIQTMFKHARHFGLSNRAEQTKEESAELIQALCKFQRLLNKDETLRMTEEEILNSIAEEIADVEICLTELKYLLCNFKTIEEIKQKKIERTENLIYKNTEGKNKNGL